MDTYKWIVHELADVRTNSWFLIESPIPVVTICALYLLVVWIGPKLMNNYKPFSLRWPLIGYNFLLVLLSLYMSKELLVHSLLRPGFSKICEPVDYSMESSSIKLASVIWWYYFSKVIELLDTVFFILRKKNNQLSFLHVYHHVTMVPLWWLGAKYVAGGEAYFSPLLNCIVHSIMYTYYLLSAFGPKMRPWLWWKKYITTMQLAQFGSIVIHTGVAIVVNCGFPRSYLVALIAYCFSHIYLFMAFYRKTYIHNKSQNGHINGTTNPKQH